MEKAEILKNKILENFNDIKKIALQNKGVANKNILIRYSESPGDQKRHLLQIWFKNENEEIIPGKNFLNIVFTNEKQIEIKHMYCFLNHDLSNGYRNGIVYDFENNNASVFHEIICDYNFYKKKISKNEEYCIIGQVSELMDNINKNFGFENKIQFKY